MATSILNQIYKEAAVTSKGVVQMNRTLNKIYDDQEKSNKRQDKFINDLQGRQRREQREEKKRQSDLKKAIAGVSASRTKSGTEENKLDLGGGKGGLVGAVVGGVTKSLGVLSTAIGALFKSKFAWMAAMLPLLRPILRGDGNRDPRHPSQRPNVDTGRDPRGTNQANPNQSAVEQIRNTPLNELPGLVGGVTGEDVIEGFTPVTRPNTATASPAKAVPKGNWFTRGMGKVGKMFGGFGKFLGKLAGPAILVWTMKDTVAKLWNNKQYKDLARYVIKTVASYGLGILTGKALYGLATLLGIATGGAAAIPAFVGATLAASAVSGYSERAIDALLIKYGLTDESTGEEPPIPDKPEGLTAESLENAAGKEEELRQKLDPQKRQKGGGIFDVPGHGQGDQVPMMLPPGAFVLNRVAAQEMFARGGSPSGLVPTLLEPGEKVFMPGDPLMDMAMSFNASFSRFQEGGMVHPELAKMSDNNIKLKTSGEGMCVAGTLDTMQASGVAQPALTGRDKGNNPRGAIVQMIKDYGWKSMGGTPTELNSPYGDVNTGVFSRAEYDSLVNEGKIPSGALVFQTRHNTWNGTSPGSRGYDMAIAQQGGQKLWNGGMGRNQMIDKYVYGNTKKVVVLTPDGKGADGSTAPMNSEPNPQGTSPAPQATGLLGAVGGAFGSLTNTLDNIFSANGPMQNLMGAFSDQMQSVAGKMFEHLNSPEVKQLTSDIQEQVQGMMSEMFGSGSSQQVSSTPQASSEAMKAIREAMDPEAHESPTIVQVVPGGESTEEPTINGQMNDNVPVGLSTRCSSWASADYRYDRSLNTETL